MLPFLPHRKPFQFGRFGRIRNIWIARKPPGFAFIEFDDPRDAEDAVKKLDGAKRRKELKRRVFSPLFRCRGSFSAFEASKCPFRSLDEEPRLSSC